MAKSTATVTINWSLTEGSVPPAAVRKALTEALKDHVETIDFSRELTDRLMLDYEMGDGYLEVDSATMKNPSSVEEKSRRRDRVAKGRKKKAKGRKKRSLAIQRALRGT